MPGVNREQPTPLNSSDFVGLRRVLFKTPGKPSLPSGWVQFLILTHEPGPSKFDVPTSSLRPATVSDDDDDEDYNSNNNGLLFRLDIKWERCHTTGVRHHSSTTSCWETTTSHQLERSVARILYCLVVTYSQPQSKAREQASAGTHN